MAEREAVFGQDPVVAEAIQRWQACAEAEDTQRKMILLAKQMRSGDQWPEEIRIQRQGGAAIQGQAAQPPRPCLTIDRLSQPVRQVSNTVRAAHFGIDVLPNGHGADEDTADIFKGLIRRIQNQARDEAPIEWAADSAAEGGIGWFRILTEYVQVPEGHQGPELFDQDIKFARIANSLSVYCDPFAQKPTRSDARFMFVVEDLSRDEYKRLYGSEDISTLDSFATTGNPKTRDWVNAETIRIAEYWRVEYVKEPALVELMTGEIVPKTKEIPKELIKRERVVARPVVKWSKINAVKELESGDWAGSKIPLIPILGEELNVDGKTLLQGVIAAGFDSQRMLNFGYSAIVEAYALMTKAPWIVAEGQTEGYETMWQNANRYNYSTLIYKPTTLAGSLVAPPQMNVPNAAALGPATDLIAHFEEALKATTSTWDPSLGNTSPTERSGKAIRALQQQGELSHSHYLDNVQRAEIYAGTLLLELAPKVYDRPGRLLQILGQDDTPQQVLVGQPFQMQKNVPVPVSAADAANRQQGEVQFYDLSKGQYAVTVSVNSQYTTKREQESSMLADLIPHLIPQMGAALAPEMVENMDIPRAHKLAEIMRKTLPPELQSDEDGQDAAATQQKLSQAMVMVEQLTAHVNDLTQQITTKQVESQAKLQQTQMDNATKVEIAKIQAGASLAVADLKSQLDAAKLVAEQLRTIVDAAEKHRLALHEHVHDASMQAMQHQHERELAAQTATTSDNGGSSGA